MFLGALNRNVCLTHSVHVEQSSESTMSHGLEEVGCEILCCSDTSGTPASYFALSYNAIFIKHGVATPSTDCRQNVDPLHSQKGRLLGVELYLLFGSKSLLQLGTVGGTPLSPPRIAV